VSRLSRRLERARPQDAQLTTIAAYPSALAWSPRGDVLAVAGDQGAVELIDPGTCAVRRRISAHDGPVQSMVWHPQRDALLTTGQDGAARLWESPFDTARELIAPSTIWADHACWSASGDRAAVTLGARAHVLSEDGVTAVTEAVASTIAALAFTPSGKSLGAACYGGVQLFDPATGCPTRKLEWKGSMLSIMFAPDGSTVACGCQTWQPVLRLACLAGALQCPAGTVERDTCDGQWPSVAAQLGVMPAACGTGPDGVVDGPRGDAGASGRRSGCCDAGDSSGALLTALCTLIGLIMPRRGLRRPTPLPRPG